MSSGLSFGLGVLGGGIGSTLLISNPVSEVDKIDREAIEFIRYMYQ